MLTLNPIRLKIWANKMLKRPELETLEWDILNPDRFINLEINNKESTSIIQSGDLNKRRLSINPDIHYSKVSSSEVRTFCFINFGITYSSLSYADLRIKLIPIRYPVMVISHTLQG